MKFNARTILSSCSAVAISAGLMLPSQAMAQDQSGASDADLDVIFVTARKRQETLTEIPISVKAFSQDDLDKRGITASAELSDYVVGFKFEPVGTGGQAGRASPAVRFRGVGVQVGLAGSASAGALFWDSAFVPQGIGVVPLIDLAQTEVLKGPQAAYFGRNTFAGAVNFIPAEPGDELEVRVRGQVSTTDVQTGYNVNAIVSGPITDNFGARIAVSQEKRPGVVDFQDGTALGEENTTAILGMLKLEAGDSTVFKASGYFVDSDDTSVLGSVEGQVGAGECNRTYTGTVRDIATGETIQDFSTDISQSTRDGIFCGEIPDWDPDSSNFFTPITSGPPTGDIAAGGFPASQVVPDAFGDGFLAGPDGLGNTYRTWRFHLSGEHELDGGHTIGGFVSFGENANVGIFDNTYGRGGPDFTNFFAPIDIFYTGFIRQSEDLSAELRFTSNDDGRFRYLVGVNYFEEDTLNFNIGQQQLAVLKSKVIGVFGSIEFDVTDEITFGAEGRFQSDTLDEVFNNNITMFEGFAGEGNEQKYEKFMPRVILQYEPEGMNLNLYANWSLSYLQGTTTEVEGFNNNPNVAEVDNLPADEIGIFTPTQKLNAFEVGIKHDPFDNFSYSIAAYYMDWSNQTFFQLSPFPVFANVNLAGDSKYKGIEVEGRYSPTDWLVLSGGYNYVDAEFTDFVGAGSVGSQILNPALGGLGSRAAISSDGNKIRYIPAHEATVSADFDLEGVTGMESFFRADLLYTGSFFIDNFEWNKVSGAARVNIRAGANITEYLAVEVFGNNIFDNRRFQTNGGTTSGAFGSGVARRAFGVPVRGDEWGIRVTASF